MPIEYSTSTKGRGHHQGLYQRPSESAEEPDHPGGLDMVRWFRREARPLEPKLMVNPRLVELETTKEGDPSKMSIHILRQKKQRKAASGFNLGKYCY